MKRAAAFMISALILLFTAVPTFASTVNREIDGVKFSIGSEYEVSTAENLASSSTVEGLIFVAISKDGKHQIKAQQKVSEYSTEMQSFKSLSHEDLAPVAQKFDRFKNGYDTSEIGNAVYLKSSVVADDGYEVIYVTVSNGKWYTFTYFGSDPTKMGEFMGSVTLPQTPADKQISTLWIIILSVSILVFTVVIVLLIMSFIKDYRHRKMEQSENIVSNYIKIKRRKY